MIFLELPIALFLNVALDGTGEDHHFELFWEAEIARFKYFYVALLSLNAIDYLARESYLRVALTALMKIPKEDIVRMGAEALQRIQASNLNDQQKFLLGECVEAYLPIKEEQEEEPSKPIRIREKMPCD